MPIDGRTNRENGDATPIKAAEYVRMSTEHQRYSTDNQSDVIRSYAKRHNMEIVATFSDEGKSGLQLKGREALRELIDIISDGQATFSALLVFDISRWGRFQDADESAYYEYICRSSGIEVHYCAEQFRNDGSPVSTIIKSVKRAMAGEYSRELSSKVFVGQCRLIQLGYRQGGPSGYGLRRMLIDEHGNQKAILERGQQKSIQTDRVILVPGPEQEIKIVHKIYDLFVTREWSENEIADHLNSEGVFNDYKRPWTRDTIRQILTNEKYIGNNVFNRTSFKLKKRRTRNSHDKWIRAEAVFEAIVPQHLFLEAQELIKSRTIRHTDDELLSQLEEVYKEHGYLSGLVIDQSPYTPRKSTYCSRFGSLLRAYKLVGYTPIRDYRYIEINRYLREYHPEILRDTIEKIGSLGATTSIDPATDLVTINEEFSVSIILARHFTTKAGRSRWKVRFDTSLKPDITIGVRMDETNKRPLDYYLFPKLDFAISSVRLCRENSFDLEAFRFSHLGFLLKLVERISYKEVA